MKLDSDRLATAGIENPERIRSIPIQDIRVGMRVPASNPDSEELKQYEKEAQVDPSTWKKVTLICPRTDGSESIVTFLRSPDWIRRSIRLASGEEVQQVDNSLAGKSIEIVIPEIALTGMAEIVSVADCPPIAEGPGEIVTGTFCTNRAAVLDLQFSGMSEPIGVTSGHPIWSETRLEFVDAGELEVGEEVLALNGKKTYLSSITLRAGPQTVYNFEVANQHVYYVSQDGLLVHNSGYLIDYAGYIVNKTGSYMDTMASAGYKGVAKKAKRLKNPHGHHIVMQNGSLATRWHNSRSQGILQKALGFASRKDAVDSLHNMAVARNLDHSVDYAKSVYNRLREAENIAKLPGKSLETEVIKALGEIRATLEAGKLFRYGL